MKLAAAAPTAGATQQQAATGPGERAGFRRHRQHWQQPCTTDRDGYAERNVSASSTANSGSRATAWIARYSVQPGEQRIRRQQNWLRPHPPDCLGAEPGQQQPADQLVAQLACAWAKPWTTAPTYSQYPRKSAPPAPDTAGRTASPWPPASAAGAWRWSGWKNAISSSELCRQGPARAQHQLEPPWWPPASLATTMCEPICAGTTTRPTATKPLAA